LFLYLMYKINLAHPQSSVFDIPKIIIIFVVHLIVKNMTTNNSYYQLAQYVLPEDVALNFEIQNVCLRDNSLYIVLEEKLQYPHGYDATTAQPNGFYSDSEIRDFPIRDKKVFLRLKRRRWKSTSTGKSIPVASHDYVAQGTRYSTEFAAFLKDDDGYLSGDGAFIRAFLWS